MIARAPFLFLLLILIPDLYLDYRYWRRQAPAYWLLWWLPAVALTVWTMKLAFEPNFMPDNPVQLHAYLFLFGLVVVPKAVFALCSAAGAGCRRLFRCRRNYGSLIGWLAMPAIWFVLCYGSFYGFKKLTVRQLTYTSSALPAAFDGYRLVLFSDAHVGTYTGQRQWLLQRAVDSINAQRADMIVFAGDLQNAHPRELHEQLAILSSLKAKDGVYSVLGNHDYAKYVECSEAQKAANCRETIDLERQMGWTLLQNEHRTIRRGSQCLTIAGMENDGDGRHFPQRGDIKKTLKDTATDDFIVMLEHDPSSWRRRIVPDGRAQLTLSGHTHNMQFALFGWSPISLTGRETNGWYHHDHQSLYVSAGLGGLIPFRFGATGEIVVITLKRANTD